MLLAEVRGDIDLNPSAQAEQRAETLTRRLRRLFLAAYRKGRAVSTGQLSDTGGDQYQTRLYELRRHFGRHGYCIDRLTHEEMTAAQRNWAKFHGVYFYVVRPGDKSRMYAKLKARGEI
jgi:hypothetical protein